MLTTIDSVVYQRKLLAGHQRATAVLATEAVHMVHALSRSHDTVVPREHLAAEGTSRCEESAKGGRSCSCRSHRLSKANCS